jgi:hypothetical protein
MKKFIATILIFTIFGLTSASIAQEYAWEPLSPVKGVFGDVSVGSPGFGIGAGARYMFVGLNLSLMGLANSTPTYALQGPAGVFFNRNQPLPSGYEEEKFLSMMLAGDLIFYMDYFEKLSFNASIGYYSRNDSILAKNITTGSRYIYSNVTESGLCFGLGAEYVLNDNFNAGAGFHTQRGVVIRLTYLWF